MTIRLPNPTIGDKILKILGKERAVRMPGEAYERFGPYVYSEAERESFCSALIRRKGDPTPDGLVYWKRLMEENVDGRLSERDHGEEGFIELGLRSSRNPQDPAGHDFVRVRDRGLRRGFK